METIATQFAAALSNSKYTSTNDVEAIAKIADKIGTMDRATYIALRDLWRSHYRVLSSEIHELKKQRKGGTPQAEKAISECRYKRSDACAYMVLRHALKEVARRSVANKITAPAA